MGRVIAQLDSYLERRIISDKLYHLIRNFYGNYQQTVSSLPQGQEKSLQLFELLIKLVTDQLQHPHEFAIFHRSIRAPFDYYQFGLDFMRPFIDFDGSQVLGKNNLKSIQEQLKKGENVILLANHQTEPDPQVISLLLEKSDPQLAAEMVFVAGHRVISDPMAVPMSLGRNLLCIYSKKHMSHPPEEKANKIQHNQRTLKQMQELLNEGGYCIYVAPSGGRDRPNASGEVTVASFDPQSLELFWLLTQQARQPTHFYPLALQTYHLMPPPDDVEKELGERRIIHYTPVYLGFGEEVDMEHFPGGEHLDKKGKRDKRAEFIYRKVCEIYRSFPHHP